ncbi:MAG TPA: CPBP family intramembrane glutamic endopeptidase [Terriglobia bacterium]|nr:CPBP family intramembrane glutamic endopeptidase [Terriglobia bacterium]
MTGDSFLVASGRLRPVWRFFLSTLLVIFLYLFIGTFLGVLAQVLGLNFNLFASLFVVNLLVLAALLGLFKLFCLYVDEKPLAFVGLAFRGRWKFELAIGFVLGVVMILAVAGLERAFGAADFSWSPLGEGQAQKIAIWAFYSFVMFSVAGISEELSFRGYPFQRLADSIGPAGATAVFSALFGLVHLGNTSHTWISTCNTMLVGVTFAVAYFRTRALWLPVGLHVSWNLVQGYVLGLPVSGINLPASLARPQLHGAEILTGGSYGPEGGVLATAVILIGTLYLLFSKSIYVSKEMRELVLGANPPEGSEPRPAPPEGSNQADGQFPQA